MLEQRFSNFYILNIERDVANNIKTETVLNNYSTKTKKIIFKIVHYLKLYYLNNQY